MLISGVLDIQWINTEARKKGYGANDPILYRLKTYRDYRFWVGLYSPGRNTKLV